MSEILERRRRALKRKKRVSMNINGTSIRPRLSVYRSHKHLFVQVIDDDKKITLTSSTDMGIHNKIKGTKINRSKLVGEELGKKLQKIGIKNVVFDRGKNRYLGRIKQLAESVRASGITI